MKIKWCLLGAVLWKQHIYLFKCKVFKRNGCKTLHLIYLNAGECMEYIVMLRRGDAVMEITELVKMLEGYVRDLRREFHQYPELSYEEIETTKRIAAELETMGIPYEIHPEKNTGLIAIIHGAHEGSAVALRADIDALNVTEINDVDFKSRHEGKMHACGHDSHIAMLLGAARMLLAMKDDIYGTVYLIFQPAEELGSGASYMMRFGNWYDEIGAIFGAHAWIDTPAGKISVKEGANLAAGDQFTIRVHGKSGHASQPQQTVDAVVVSAAIVMNLQSIVSRHYSATEPVVLTIGMLHSGDRFNIIAGEAVMEGTTRFFDPTIGADLKSTMEQIIMDTAHAYGATAELEYKEMVLPTINDKECTAIMSQAVVDVLGKDALFDISETMGGEDFAYYLKHKPGCFAFVGIYNPAVGAVHSHHSNNFTMDDSVLSGASGVYAQSAINWLKLHRKKNI